MRYLFDICSSRKICVKKTICCKSRFTNQVAQTVVFTWTEPVSLLSNTAKRQMSFRWRVDTISTWRACYPVLKWCQIDKVDGWIGSLETITQHSSLSALLAPARIRQNGRLPFGASVWGILSEGSPTFSINLQTFCAQAALLSLPQPWVHTQSFRFN